MAEGASLHRKPFVAGAAGMEYFASEAHYRLLAATIREQLQQHGGCVLLTGDPAPSSELLVRQLTVVGALRCRGTIVKCQAEMTAAALMDSYRRLAGSSIEAMTRRVASWSTQAGAAPRSQMMDILVLDQAESLEDDVLRQLCCPPDDAREQWPPLLLIASEALVERLEAQSLAPVNSTIGARFQLHRLVQREVASFIRYQLTAGDLHQLDLFKPQVLELIEAYADGDPAVVNGLARRILRIVPELTAKRRAAQEQKKAEEQAIAAAAFAATAPLERALPVTVQVPTAAEAAPAAAAASEPLPRAAVAVDLPASLPLAPVPDAPQASSAEAAEPPTPTPEPPVVDAAEPVPAAQPVAAPEEPSPTTEAAPPDELVPPIAEAVAPLAVAPTAEPPIVEPAAPATTLDVETLLSPAPPETAVALRQTASAAILSAADEAPSATVLDFPIKASVATDTEATAANDRDAPTVAPPPRRRHIVALCGGLACVIVAGVIAFGATQRRDAEGTYLDAVVRFARGTSVFADLQQMSARLLAGAPPAPKDLSAQRLRTTTNNASDLLTAAPARTPNANIPNTKESVAISNSAGTAPIPLPPVPLPPEPSQPIAAAPAAQPSAVTPPAATAPAPSRTALGPTAPVIPVKRETLELSRPQEASPPDVAVAVALPPAPVHEPPSAAAPATPAATPAPREASAPPPPAPKESAAPAADRGLSSADIGVLLRHGDQLLTSGDIVAARHYFELVAEAGDPRAALRLGKTYDPAFLQQSGVRGVVGDPAKAKAWYLKAIASGDKEADLQLLRLMTLYP